MLKYWIAGIIYKTPSRIAVLGFCILTLPCFEVAGQVGAYYLVDGDRVELTPSNNYRAFRLALPANLQPAGVPERLGASVNAAVSPSLARHNIVVVPTGGPLSTESLRASLGSIGSIESEPPVFTVNGVDHVLVNEFTVQFLDGVSNAEAITVIAEYNGRVVDDVDASRGRYYVAFDGSNERDALTRSNQLNQDPDVRYSEPNLVRLYPARQQVMRQSTIEEVNCERRGFFSDKLLACQWALDNRGEPGTEGADINVIDAWSMPSNGAKTIVVAIVDEGVDTHHEDLAQIIEQPYDAVDEDNDQEPLSADAHGTACAGIVGAVSNNKIGIAGVAPEVRIMPVRIATGNATGGWDTENRIVSRGLEMAVDRGAHILSNSWGGGAPSNQINDAIDYGIERGRLFVFAAGNYHDQVDYPANLSSNRPIIAVSATNEWDEFKSPTSRDGEDWWGSNFGPEIVVAAPGVHIHTTDISGADGYEPGDYTATFNGTSSATPFVAGVAALILSRDPTLTPAEVRSVITRTADDLGDPGFDAFFGHGRVNAGDALRALQN